MNEWKKVNALRMKQYGRPGTTGSLEIDPAQGGMWSNAHISPGGQPRIHGER